MIDYSDSYSKTYGSLWQYYKDYPNDNITQSESFKSKIKITGKTRGWLYNWLFVRLSLFQRKLQIDCNRFK